MLKNPIYKYMAIGFVLLVVFLTLVKPKYLNKINSKVTYIDGRNVIINKTGLSYMDTIYAVGLETVGVRDKIFLIETTPLEMFDYYLKKNKKLGGAVLKKDGYYHVHMTPDAREAAIDVASHEIIHILQYESERLKIVDPLYVIWENRDTIPIPIPLKYEDVPWEHEAMIQSKALAKELKKKLLVKDESTNKVKELGTFFKFF